MKIFKLLTIFIFSLSAAGASAQPLKGVAKAAQNVTKASKAVSKGTTLAEAEVALRSTVAISKTAHLPSTNNNLNKAVRPTTAEIKTTSKAAQPVSEIHKKANEGARKLTTYLSALSPTQNIEKIFISLQAGHNRILSETDFNDMENLRFTRDEIQGIVALLHPEEYIEFLKKHRSSYDESIKFVNEMARSHAEGFLNTSYYKRGADFVYRGYKVETKLTADLPYGKYNVLYVGHTRDLAHNFLFNYFESGKIMQMVGSIPRVMPSTNVSEYGNPSTYFTVFQVNISGREHLIKRDTVEKDYYLTDSTVPEGSRVLVFNPYLMKWHVNHVILNNSGFLTLVAEDKLNLASDKTFLTYKQYSEETAAAKENKELNEKVTAIVEYKKKMAAEKSFEVTVNKQQAAQILAGRKIMVVNNSPAELELIKKAAASYPQTEFVFFEDPEEALAYFIKEEGSGKPTVNLLLTGNYFPFLPYPEIKDIFLHPGSHLKSHPFWSRSDYQDEQSLIYSLARTTRYVFEYQPMTRPEAYVEKGVRLPFLQYEKNVAQNDTGKQFFIPPTQQDPFLRMAQQIRDLKIKTAN